MLGDTSLELVKDYWVSVKDCAGEPGLLTYTRPLFVEFSNSIITFLIWVFFVKSN